MLGMVVVLLLATVPLILEGYAYRPLLSIGWYKLIHIAGGVLFIGNIVVTGVWMFMARRTNDPRIISFASDTSASVAAGSAFSREYPALLRKWFFWGAVAPVSPIASLVLMITKPTLW